MNLSPYDLAVIAGLFTIVGALIGVISSYWLSIHLSEKQQRLVAIANFRAAFSYTISQMAIAQKDKSIDIDSLLTGTFPDLATAIETYRPFVPSKDRKAYQEAWQQYYMPDGRINFYDCWMKMTNSDGMESKPHEIFTHRVESILEFANL